MLKLGAGEANGSDHLRRRVVSTIDRVRSLGLTILQVEAVNILIDGGRTATELTDQILGCEPGDSDFEAGYARMRRALKDLESKGYVSTGLFGRGRPYRLTEHGIRVLTSLVPTGEGSGILKRIDVSVFVITVASGLGLFLVRAAADWLVFAVFGFFFFMVGFSFSRYCGVLKRVV